MRAPRVRTGLAIVGGCAAVSIVLPPLAGALNAVGTLALLALSGYLAYRGWAWMESIVEASRRPSTVRRNLERESGRDAEPHARSRSRLRPEREVPAVPPPD
ncbi:MAG: hypothetical protein ACRENV_07185, partial [Candidatus Dormibacteria bacterium]